MSNKWHGVWNRRSANERAILDLEELMNLDGYDSVGRVKLKDFRAYGKIIAEKLALRDGVSIYEVGCGAGAFLYTLRENFSLHVGGNDYAAGMIETAKRLLPDGHFDNIEANLIDHKTKYDFVISAGVFLYFTADYAREVIDLMIEKAIIAIAVLEIPDIRTKEESERFRRDILTHEEYEKKYVGLEHTYYEREWFEAIAATHGLSCEVFDHCIPNYAQNKFRFGCIIRK